MNRFLSGLKRIKLPKITKIFKVFKIRYVLIALAVVAVIALIYFGISIWKGHGDNNGNGNSVIPTTTEPTSVPENNILDETEDNTVSTEIEYVYLAVTVVGNEYFYDNSSMELEGLIETITSVVGEVLVKIKYDRASHNAYDALIKALKFNRIKFEEEC